VIATVYLDNQIFYDSPTSYNFYVREGDPSAAIFRVSSHPPLLQDVHDPQSGNARKSQADAILIPGDDEFDDLDSRFGTSFG
jgi:hypothetical protein